MKRTCARCFDDDIADAKPLRTSVRASRIPFLGLKHESWRRADTLRLSHQDAFHNIDARVVKVAALARSSVDDGDGWRQQIHVVAVGARFASVVVHTQNLDTISSQEAYTFSRHQGNCERCFDVCLGSRAISATSVAVASAQVARGDVLEISEPDENSHRHVVFASGTGDGAVTENHAADSDACRSRPTPELHNMA